jgi:1,2-diacylglycerol 3-beta-galactosyltransferase
VVSVHPLLGHAAARALAGVEQGPRLAVLVTDLFSAHSVWYCRDAALVLTPSAATAAAALAGGVRRERIRISALPLRRQFGPQCREPAAQLRQRLGLGAHLPVVLLMGGAEGVGPMVEIVREVVRSNLPLQLVVISGRNQRLRRRLQEMQGQDSGDASAEADKPRLSGVNSLPLRAPGFSPGYPPHPGARGLDPAAPRRPRAPQVRILGFVDNVADWMGAADILVTKAGPTTLCEALATGLPMIISGYLPGQEEGNVSYVRAQDVGVLRTSAAAVRDELASWLGDGQSRWQERRQKAQALSSPGAAEALAGLLAAECRGSALARQVTS